MAVTVHIVIKLMHVGQHFVKNYNKFYENVADNLVPGARC